VYNVATTPNFQPSHRLKSIVQELLSLASNKGMSQEALSITLIDVNSGEFAEYQQEKLRYPASVAKLFWMVILYSKLQKGMLPDEQAFTKDLEKMVVRSDNEATSHIIDQITDTTSGSPLKGEAFQLWLNKRYQMNSFFEEADYGTLDISQKTFPISNDITEPIGPDQQIRQIQGKDLPPIRNFLSTYAVARLLGEIAQEQTISPEYSQEIKQLLKRDLNPSKWQRKPFNPIAGFLGESLPRKTEFWAKMGWTFNNRNDAAIISSPNREINYILVIFGDDAAYYQDKRFFPLLSKQVFETSSLRTDSL
jgi:beta-lactamase class A